jgi:hypothetical protein
MKIVAGGPAAVSVTVNVAPVVATVKGWKSFPATLTVPEKLSVETGAVGVGVAAVVDVLLLPPHADAMTTASPHTRRRIVILSSGSILSGVVG